MTTCGSGGSDCRGGCCEDKKPASACSTSGNERKDVKACGSGCCGGDDKKPAATTNDAIANGSDDKPDTSHTKCLAVIRENGTEVVLFDVTGVPRSFTYKGDAGKPCFSTHGNGQVDDLLTPCFDEDGKHGDPEESCFCGVDAPHIHAHKYDPKTCKDDSNKKNAQGETDLQFLAQLTLHPMDKNAASSDEVEPLVNMAVSAQLPKQCNSKEISRHMSERGLTQSVTRQRMHKVQHDDHVDYLVHDHKTGQLTLEHPCDSCGDTDLHGQFHPVGKRNIQGNSEIVLHFFEVAPSPFYILDHLSRLFDPNAERVVAARPARDDGHVRRVSRDDVSAGSKKTRRCCASGPCDQATPLLDDMLKEFEDGKTVRSTFTCTDICCASEIPVINEVLVPVNGVKKVLIDVPGKKAIVCHEPSFVSAKDIEDVLNKNGFAAEIACDGAVSQATGSTLGRSQFFVQKICCASEIPAINAIVEPISGVTKVSINTTTKMVYVDHDTEVVSATEIVDALNDNRFGALVRHDAAKDIRAQATAFVRSTFAFEPTSIPDIDTLKEFSGTFDPSQVEAFVVDVPAKKIRVVHNAHILSVGTIVAKLADEAGIEATIVVNGAESADWDFPEIEEELERLDEVASRPSIPTILSGFFWLISMLSLIGGNWYVPLFPF